MADLGGESYDIIIAGAGMVGASAACLLAQARCTRLDKPLKIALIESASSSPSNFPSITILKSVNLIIIFNLLCNIVVLI